MSADRQAMEARRRRLVEGVVARYGIDEAMIERLVHAFYARVRADPSLGPIFATRVTDWDAHLARMCAFWSSVTLLSGRYHGQPMAAHLPLPVGPRHFARWLEIFDATAREICPPETAAYFSERAHRVAASLEAGIVGQAGRSQPILEAEVGSR